jgi:ABC-type methionine transport system ATPase subunit
MMQVETTRHFSLRFPQEMIREPILHNISVKFGVAFCILSANVTESVGYLTLSFSASDPSRIESAITYLRDRGVDISEQPVPVNA